MSNEAQAAPASQTKPKVARVSADNRYPVYDLNSSLELAKAVKEKGGNASTPEQLGGHLGYKNTKGGGFVSRVASARAFGLIRTVQGHYEITPRAESILYRVTEEAKGQALRDAWFSIPLYKQIYERHKGTQLPEEFGMRNLLHTQYQVPSGDRVALAYRVMMDSAETAGFFRAHGNRTHLVDPVQGTPGFIPTPPPPPTDTPFPKPGGGGNGGGGSRRFPKLIEGALEELPEEGPWAEADMEDWFEFFKSAVKRAYRVRRAD
jgi:hypothetical protein